MPDPLRLLVLGAHPDDAEFGAGGLAATYRGLGHTVRMISLTNGDAGHHESSGPPLAARRRAEAAASGRIIGADYVARLRDLTLALYAFGTAHAESRGIILADTKFEFGLTPEGDILLIDEAMTPDSSRYWPRDQYEPGRPQPSFDKQYVRDYLEEIRWNKQPPVPTLPDEVVARTREKYLEAFRRLTGREIE